MAAKQLPANNFHAPHIKNAAQLLAHRSQFHLKAFVDKSINDPTHCVSILIQLLAKEPERVTGFVELGGLNHFNTFLKSKKEALAVLQILAHQNFPFYYEHIESSGLAQTLFELQQRPSPLQKPAKRVIDIWREKHSKSKQKKRKRKVKFVDERRLTTSVKFEQQDPVCIIRRNIAKAKRTSFRPTVKWRIPLITRESAVRTLKINQKIKSEAKTLESTRQRTILEETITRAMHTPADNYTPGLIKKETVSIPNEDKPMLPTTQRTSMSMLPANTIPPLAAAPLIAHPSAPIAAPPIAPVHNTIAQLPVKRPFSAVDNQKVQSLFHCLEEAGFPNPKRVRYNPPQANLPQAPLSQDVRQTHRQQVVTPRPVQNFNYAPNYPPKQDNYRNSNYQRSYQPNSGYKRSRETRDSDKVRPSYYGSRNSNSRGYHAR